MKPSEMVDVGPSVRLGNGVRILSPNRLLGPKPEMLAPGVELVDDPRYGVCYMRRNRDGHLGALED